MAARLRNSHPAKADERWSNERWKDEQIFQAARRHVIAVMQVILPGSVDQIQSNGIIVGEGRGGEGSRERERERERERGGGGGQREKERERERERMRARERMRE